MNFNDLTAEEQNAINALTEQPLPEDEKKVPDTLELKPIQEVLPVMETPPIQTHNSPSKIGTRGFVLDDTPPKDSGLELAEQNMPHNVPNNMMRDGFSYSISMKKNGKNVSMTFDDMTAPPEIVEIFQKYVQY